MAKSCDLIVNATPADMPLLRLIGQNFCEACDYPGMTKVLVIDMAARRHTYRRADAAPVTVEDYPDVLGLFDKVTFLAPDRAAETRVLRRAFRASGHRSDHRGGPIYQYLGPILDSTAEYFCHLDCDILFYTAPGVNWISQAISTLEAHDDVAAAAPHSGPACTMAQLAQPTGFTVRERGDLRLIDFVSTRKFVMSKDWLLSQLPMAPRYSGRRDRLRALVRGTSALLPLEVHLSGLFREQGLWRADLPADQAWCLHLPSHSAQVQAQLPGILSRIAANDVPDGQRGHFDLRLEGW